jgi:hypothetical protein
MCLVAFIASDRELPLIARAPAAVGAQGCACDFQVEADADDSRSLVSLADYLERAVQAGPIDFFAAPPSPPNTSGAARSNSKIASC